MPKKKILPAKSTPMIDRVTMVTVLKFFIPKVNALTLESDGPYLKNKKK